MVKCGFRPGRSTTDQIFTLKQIFEKSWEYGKDLFGCFVVLEKVYDGVPRDKLWEVLQEYGVNGQLLRTITSFYCQPEMEPVRISQPNPIGKLKNLRTLTGQVDRLLTGRSTGFLQKVFVHCLMHLMKNF